MSRWATLLGTAATVGRSAIAASVLVVAVATAVVVGGGGVAGAAVTTATATVINPYDQQILSGGSETNFGLSLPSSQGGQTGSSEVFCANYSSSSPQYLYSYLVPKGTDPGTLTFTQGYPSTGGGLFESTGYFGDIQTATANGELPSLPTDFAWQYDVTNGIVSLDALLYQDGNTSGVWEAGLACVDPQAGDVTTLWNVEVTFIASGSDPNGFTWTVPAPPPPTTTTTTTEPTRGGSGLKPSGNGSGSAPSTSGRATTGGGSPASSASGADTSTSGADAGSDADGGQIDEGSGTTIPGSGTGTAKTAAPAASGGGEGGTSGPGFNASVKDPGIIHDALTAAGFSTPAGVAIDLLGAGLLLMVLGIVYRRRVQAAPAGGESGEGSNDGPENGSGNGSAGLS